MKKLVLVFILAANFSGYGQTAPPKNTATLPPVKLTSSADSMNYMLGAFMGLWISNNALTVNNPSLFLRGFDDIFQNRTRVVPDSLVPLRVNAYQQAAQKGRAILQEQQLFASMKDRPGIGMFPNGVRYIILKSGKGPRPFEEDSIVLNLTARLVDGTVIEDTYQTKKPFETKPTAFFPGLNEALLQMTEGSKWQLFIPSVLAYGDKTTGLIPPNSALILEAELMAVKPARK